MVAEVEELTYQYARGFLRPRKVTALDQVSVDIREGSITSLLGPNGSGKTTLLRTLVGVTTPTSGSVRIFGAAPGSIGVKRRVSFLPEVLWFPKHLNAFNFLYAFSRLGGLQTTRAEVTAALKQVDLSHVAERNPNTFSKGMKIRLGICRCLLRRSDFYILDEPTEGLDPLGVAIVRDVLLRLNNEGATVLISSHNLTEIERVSQDLVFLVDGRVRHQATVASLDKRLDEMFIEIVRG